MNSENIKKVTSQALKQLMETLDSGASEALTRYLGAMARFSTYSFLNVLLILKACPNATSRILDAIELRFQRRAA